MLEHAYNQPQKSGRYQGFNSYIWTTGCGSIWSIIQHLIRIKYYEELRDALEYCNIETKYKYDENIKFMRQYLLDTQIQRLYASSFKYIWRHNFIPDVSVILSDIDNIDKLKFSVSSLLAQTLDTIEIILIIDDKWTDEVKSAYAEAKNVRIFGAPNGAYRASVRNLGVKFARGKYVTFMRCGDVMAQETLQIYSSLAGQSKTAIIYPTGVYEAANPEMLYREEWTLKSENNAVTEPTIFKYDLSDRLNRLFSDSWYKGIEGVLYKRDFLLYNEISFHSFDSDDFRFTFECLCKEEDCVKTPVVGYIRVGET